MSWFCCASAAVFLNATTATHAQIGLYELARFDLSLTANDSNAQFIGSNPIAVGWNGSKLYIAGFNSGTATATTAIIEVTNAASVTNFTASGFLTPTYSSTFAGLSSPASRGYTGLAMQGGQLAASFDGGSNNQNGIQMFDAATNTQSWTNVIKFTTTSGSAITPTYTFLANPLTSTGAYDFEWDSATQTLAVPDYTNRNVSIFSTAVPEPSSMVMVLASSVGMVAMLLGRARRRIS